MNIWKIWSVYAIGCGICMLLCFGFAYAIHCYVNTPDDPNDDYKLACSDIYLNKYSISGYNDSENNEVVYAFDIRRSAGKPMNGVSQHIILRCVGNNEIYSNVPMGREEKEKLLELVIYYAKMM